MNWAEAKESTIGLWTNIRESIGRVEEIELLAEINAVCDLCERAREEAAPRESPCRYCLAYQQAGGCQAVSLEMSDLVVQRRWDDLREWVDAFIAQLESVEIPEDEQR